MTQSETSPTEATTLLATRPSPHSTDSPTPRNYSSEAIALVSSYEDLRQSVENELKALDGSSGSKKDPDNRGNKFFNKQHAILILMVGCALVIVLFSVISYSASGKPTGSHGDSGRTMASGPKPFSTLDPVRDLHLPSFARPVHTGPAKGLLVDRPEWHSPSDSHTAVPTNAWYQNLLVIHDEPSNLHRVYSTPYVLDLVGRIPGLRAHRNHVLASSSVMQLTFNEQFGLTIGAGHDFTEEATTKDLTHTYNILETTELGLTLQWNVMNMTSTIVRGMAYTTMEYPERETTSETGDKVLPTISSPIDLTGPALVDGKSKMDCSEDGVETLIKKELELRFFESDYTWLVFFSEPVWVQCKSQGGTLIQVVAPDSEQDEKNKNETLVIRAALLDTCNTGRNQISCKHGMGDRMPEEDQIDEYRKVLEKFSAFYPGRQSSVSYQIDDDSSEGYLNLDWDVQVIPGLLSNASSTSEKQSLRRLDELPDKPSLIMFALPHHIDRFGSSSRPNGLKYCKTSLNGPTCLVEGAVWTLKEDLPRIGLQAARPPRAQFVQPIAEALEKDITYSLPVFFERGAGDTYFSGKMLSKLGRILLIAEELSDICDGTVDVADNEEYQVACNNVTLPSVDSQKAALNRLRSSVEVWINGTAETPFVYDEAWGGVVSCGCIFNGEKCDNTYPDCPAFSDQGLNFGNGFYNDHHYHYGYHIHAAAVVAHFDHDWGKKHYEQVLLLVRNIANPSRDDRAFPLFRHKDWYQGSSWASGVPLPPYLNGKNQESSSEAIAAYEAVALFGQVMGQVWSSAHKEEEAAVAKEIMKVGQMMTATEIRSTQKYWHVKHKNKTQDILPEAYTSNVVGILWSTMAQFGTWFGAAGYLPYGIQLLPITPISEERDEMEWMNEMYYPFSQACADFHQCTESGWAVLQLSVLATVGYANHAAERVKELLPQSYENAGGNGQSKSNTLWYIATRPVVENPVAMAKTDVRGDEEIRPAPVYKLTDCHTPDTCTPDILDHEAGLHTCRSRMNWLIHSSNSSQWEACSTVASEYPLSCGDCTPGNKDKTDIPVKGSREEDFSLQCEACTLEQCHSDLNRCPATDRTFVCTDGASRGGCSSSPWTLGHEQCNSCCEMTDCQKLRDHESKKVTQDGTGLDKPRCPPCKSSVCYSSVNQCPLHTAPYLCLEGVSVGGCASTPWKLDDEDGQCSECCEITYKC